MSLGKGTQRRSSSVPANKFPSLSSIRVRARMSLLCGCRRGDAEEEGRNSGRDRRSGVRNRRPFRREHGRLRTRLGVTVLIMAALAVAVAVSAGAQPAKKPPPKKPTPLAQARAFLKLAYRGSSVLPSPASRPAAKGKNVTIISSGQNSISSAVPVAGEMEACAAIGWTCTVYDGKSDPSTWPGLVRQAIAARTDGIILQAIDCPLIEQPLREAKAAGIK